MLFFVYCWIILVIGAAIALPQPFGIMAAIGIVAGSAILFGLVSIIDGFVYCNRPGTAPTGRAPGENVRGTERKYLEPR